MLFQVPRELERLVGERRLPKKGKNTLSYRMVEIFFQKEGAEAFPEPT